MFSNGSVKGLRCDRGTADRHKTDRGIGRVGITRMKDHIKEDSAVNKNQSRKEKGITYLSPPLPRPHVGLLTIIRIHL